MNCKPFTLAVLFAQITVYLFQTKMSRNGWKRKKLPREIRVDS